MKNIVHALYRKLLTLYPPRFKEQLGESIEQTFTDIYKERQTKPGLLNFVLWVFIETTMGIVREHVLVIREGATMKNSFTNIRTTALISSVLLAVAFIVAPFIYLVGNLRDALGPFAYDLADFLSGPVWAASLISLVFMLRERIGERAPHRMSLALLATVLAAATMIIIACIRSANRHYHLMHPELHLEEESTVLIVWTTLVSGLTGAGWHFLGWAMLLIGSASWAVPIQPRVLGALYFLAGITSLFVYILPNSEVPAGILSMVVMIWQGILLWKGESKKTQAINSNQA